MAAEGINKASVKLAETVEQLFMRFRVLIF